jgi:hypoxanthine phosphoribosyltransferase
MSTPVDIDPGAVLAACERLYSQPEVATAADAWADAIAHAIAPDRPLLVACMVGGAQPLGMLLERLHFPLEVDYIHATRYRGGTRGHEVEWLHLPASRLSGRTVLVVDDLLDAGNTLAAISNRLHAMGAARVYTAVLVTKDVPGRAGLQAADFSALHAPNRWLVGCGMDYHGWLRNAPGIYALPPDMEH